MCTGPYQLDHGSRGLATLQPFPARVSFLPMVTCVLLLPCVCLMVDAVHTLALRWETDLHTSMTSFHLWPLLTVEQDQLDQRLEAVQHSCMQAQQEAVTPRAHKSGAKYKGTASRAVFNVDMHGASWKEAAAGYESTARGTAPTQPRPKPEISVSATQSSAAATAGGPAFKGWQQGSRSVCMCRGCTLLCLSMCGLV